MNSSALLVKIGVVAFYLVAWFVTRHFYRRHKPEIVQAVEDGRAQPYYVAEESNWFHKATLWLGILALVGTFVPQGWWLAAYMAVTSAGYLTIASFSESMLRSDIRKAEYDPDSQPV